MKNEKKILYDILKNFNGMGKIEAYNITHKLETALFYASSPIKIENLEQFITSDYNQNDDIDPFHFTILPNGNFCEFVGCSDWLHIYKENKAILPNWPIFETYYFKTKYAPLDLKKLSKKKLLMEVKNKPEEIKIIDFLTKHSVGKKDIISNRLLILDL